MIKELFITLFLIGWSESKRFREHGYQLPGAYDTRETRGIPGAINVNGAEHMDMILQKMKDLGYDKYHKPNPSGKLDVSTNMFIDSIQDISESGMTYEMTIFFRQFWIDPRLAWAEVANENNETIQYKRADDQYNVAADMIDLLWKPDTYFIDEIDSRRHNIMTKNVFLEIHRNGYILLSERLSLKLKCPMLLKYYPFDLQICPIRIESYAFRDSQLNIKWHEETQIGINEEIALPTFTLSEFLVRPECSREFSTGSFSCLEGFLILRRRISYYFTHMFIPSYFCVIVSWASFWIKIDSAPARVTCGILTFLAISAWTQAFNADMPKVSYTKAIDVWSVTCFVFVFLSLVEYPVAQVLLRMKQNDIKRRQESGELDFDHPEVKYWDEVGAGNEGIWVDKLSRKLFPLLFTIFNIIYWTVCCVSGHIPYPEGVESNPVKLADG